MKQFYLEYPEGSAIPDDVGDWKKGSSVLSPSSTTERGSAPMSLSSSHSTVLFPAYLGWTHYLLEVLGVEGPSTAVFGTPAGPEEAVLHEEDLFHR